MDSRGCTVVLDTETTGLLDDPWATVVELGAAVLSPHGRVVGTWGSLVRPLDPIPDEAAEAFAVNGLTREELAAADTWRDVCGRFLAWLHGLDPLQLWGVGRVTSYNADFDRTMIERTGGLYAGPWLGCIQLLAGAHPRVGRHPKQRHPDRPPLWYAAQQLGVTQVEPRHRAVSDAETAARVLVELTR